MAESVVSSMDAEVPNPATATVRKRKLDSELGPGTIESEDEIEIFSNSDSDSEDEMKYRVKKQGNESEFYNDFNFVDSVKDYHKDSWAEVMKYIKPKKTVDLSKTIAKVRLEEKERRAKRKAENPDESDPDIDINKEHGESDSSGTDSGTDEGEDPTEEFLPDITTKDQLKLRKDEVKRKERKKDRPVKLRKSVKELLQEEQDAQFFEDAPPCEPDTTFLEMNFSRSLLRAIDRLGYDQPTAIQAATIPVALQGRDICGCAATGTGKTAAYMLPILERLLFKPKSDIVTRVLVLVPTRELGVQVFQVSKELSRYSVISIALSVGGLDLQTQEAMLKKVPDIVIATPGRLIDHILNTPTFSLESIEILVLDEADRMLEDCFEEQMKEIIKQCAVQRQTMLFSATMTSQVKQLALVSLKNPVKVFVNENTDVARNLRQEFVRIRKNQEHTREAMLAYLVSRSFSHKCMVFVETKVKAHELTILLGLLGMRTGELHGNLKQADRLLSLQKFRDEEIDVLIATDVAARGLDIKGVKTVINFNLPSKYTKYVHRVGRTARAGHCGRSVSLAGEKEFLMLKEIKRSSKSAMFERVLNKDVLAKYVDKIKKLSHAVKRVLWEELEEKKLRSMENSIKSMEKKLNATAKNFEIPAPERTWFQTEEDIIKAKTKKLAAAGKKINKTGKPGKRNKKIKTGNPEERRFVKEIRLSQINAKKSNKMKRVTAFNEVQAPYDTVSQKKQVKNKSTSSFDAELTRTGRKSVKKFRSGPSYSERKEVFQVQNPGKKFKAKKKQGNK